MRDFPVFTTNDGVGSLVLHNVPYWGMAYLKVQSAADPLAFIQEAASFCRSAGADRVYASGNDSLQKFYPFHTSVIRMQGVKNFAEETGTFLMPVTENTSEQWRNIYNSKMKDVCNASYMTAGECRTLYSRGESYFVHRDQALIGIGAVEDNKIKALASVQKGMGDRVLNALMSILPDDPIELEVASGNRKAISLYERAGFIQTSILSSWYQII